MASSAAKSLGKHYVALGTSTRRLSSGLRVGTAADDAAGLAIRELMRADIASHHQGLRNINDGISMIQVADGALSVIDEKLIRMKELATQAATGTYNADQRLIINDEFQAMKREIQRISEATDFNGIKVINDEVLNFEVDPQQVNVSGFGSPVNTEGGIISYKGDMYAVDQRSRVYRYEGGTWNRISPGADNRLSPNGTYTGLRIVDDKLTVHVQDNVDGAKIFQMDQGGTFTQILPDGINGDSGNYRAVIEEYSGEKFLSVNNAATGANLYTYENGQYEAIAENGLGDPDNTALYVTNFNGRIFMGSNNGTGAFFKEYDRSNGTWNDVSLDGLNNNDININFTEVDGNLYVATRNNVDGTKVYELSEFGWKTITKDGFGDPNNIHSKVFNVAGKRVISVRNDPNGGSLHTITKDGIKELASGGLGDTNNRIIDSITTNGTDVFASTFNPTSGMQVLKVGEVESNGPLIHFGAGNDSAEDYYRITSGDAGISASGLGIGNLNVASQTSAQYSLAAIDDAIVKKDKIRANLGATQNRLENSATNISIQAENLQAAESRISDVDVATETTEFTKEQILSQTATAMLAQANSMPRTILRLIEGG
jgi:flagellin